MAELRSLRSLLVVAPVGVLLLSSCGTASLMRGAASSSSSNDFETCYVETEYVKGCSTVTENHCEGCDWDGSPNELVCGDPCVALCQNGQTSRQDGSDPSCHPADAEWPEYMESCKAWDYHLGDRSWTKPYDFDLYAAISRDDDGLKRMCLGPGSISFPRQKFPCAIHQSAYMTTCSSGGPYVDGGEAQFNLIRDAFLAKMDECGASVWNKEFCVVDVDGIEEGGKVQLAMSIGHGVLNGVCGSIALMTYSPPDGWTTVDCKSSNGACKDKEGGMQRMAPTGFGKPRYMINMQAGMRSWSGEFMSYSYLAPDNAGGDECDVPSVKTVDWQTVQAWLATPSYKVSCDRFGCTKMS